MTNGQFVTPTMFVDLKKVLQFNGVFKRENTGSYWPIARRILTILTIVILKALLCISAFMYSVKFHNLSEMFQSACYSYITMICSTLIYLYLIFNCGEIERLVSAWEMIFQKRGQKSRENSQHYSNWNIRITNLIRHAFYMVVVLLGSGQVVCCLMPIYYVLNGNLNPETWVLPFHQFL